MHSAVFGRIPLYSPHPTSSGTHCPRAPSSSRGALKTLRNAVVPPLMFAYPARRLCLRRTASSSAAADTATRCERRRRARTPAFATFAAGGGATAGAVGAAAFVHFARRWRVAGRFSLVRRRRRCVANLRDGARDAAEISPRCSRDLAERAEMSPEAAERQPRG